MGIVSYEGIGEVVITVMLAEDMKMGQVVRMVENQWAGPCTDGDEFCGVIVSMRDFHSGVQVKGFVPVKFTGEMKLGWVSLVGNGYGGVRQGDGGVKCLVTHVDAESEIAMICL